MRRIIIASLFLSTVLLNAQTATPGQGVTMEATSEAPNAPSASTAADSTATPHVRRMSTGVKEPKLISDPSIDVDISDFNAWNLGNQYMVVHLKVDETGKAQDVAIVKTVSPEVDAKVLDAVQQFHFSPAKLDDHAIPMDLDMRINFQAR